MVEQSDGFNPRAPRGTRHGNLSFIGPEKIVSIHAPRAGRDSVFGALKIQYDVSIHAPRAGRDSVGRARRRVDHRFNPRAPRGTRLDIGAGHRCHPGFNPRAPRGTRPLTSARAIAVILVSIHAPRAGRDSEWWIQRVDSARFNPRAPRGTRQGRRIRRVDGGYVSIHAPRAGRDFRACWQDPLHA